jgi:hypothetical protein
MNKNLLENLISQMNAENDTMKRKKLLVKIKMIEPGFIENNDLANNIQNNSPEVQAVSEPHNPAPSPEISIKEISREEPVSLKALIEKRDKLQKMVDDLNFEEDKIELEKLTELIELYVEPPQFRYFTLDSIKITWDTKNKIITFDNGPTLTEQEFLTLQEMHPKELMNEIELTIKKYFPTGKFVKPSEERV